MDNVQYMSFLWSTDEQILTTANARPSNIELSMWEAWVLRVPPPFSCLWKIFGIPARSNHWMEMDQIWHGTAFLPCEGFREDKCHLGGLWRLHTKDKTWNWGHTVRLHSEIAIFRQEEAPHQKGSWEQSCLAPPDMEDWIGWHQTSEII